MKHFNPNATSLFANAVNLDNIIFDTDSYKLSHFSHTPDGTEIISSYIEARKPWGEIDTALFFGLQIELVKLAGQVVTQADLDEATPYLKAHGFDIYVAGWQHIIDVHGGHLPILIEALPEGTLAPISVPQVRIRNTDARSGWLVSYLETRLLRAIWYASTVASLSHYVVGAIGKRMQTTDGTTNGVAFKLHDFGARGAAARDAAGIGGAAHLVSSMGTDTIMGTLYARNFYGADMAGYSINATEHSTMTALGRKGELEQLTKFVRDNPTGIIACVSDSYDLFHFIKTYLGVDLKQAILARDGTFVVRPDSGDPIEIVPAVIEALMDVFGYTVTDQGYRLLNEKVRVIQGDGVNKDSVVQIMDAMMERGLAIGNIAFGMGGGLLQKVDRDTMGYAMKASANFRDGAWHDVYKDPITAKGSKTSKRGRQGVMLIDGKLTAARVEDIPQGEDMLTEVFWNGVITRLQTFDEIRARAWPKVA
ncbi:nicotinate phosphoribosyltransferase [Loktanella sp. DJP18]|uniref:nicotinate phosphoribosyltransferase n=1 Tax=Loktanella sp. DJP18 TaxID=3409788 RepID=UPI003BB574D0